MQKRKVKRLIWDIETSPNVGLFWRCGWKQSIPPHLIVKERAVICIAYKWEGGKKTSCLTWDDGDDGPMLRRFAEIANEADELVAHNGDKFDLKFFKGRCLFHRIKLEVDQKTVDTYQLARRRFDLNSFSLKYLAQFLGIKKGKDEMEFQDWVDITLHNSRKKMRKMVKYCKQDVDLLEEVWDILKDYHNAKTHAGVYAGLDKWTCAACGSQKVRKNKTRITTYGTMKHDMQCRCCGRHYTISNTAFKQYKEAKS